MDIKYLQLLAKEYPNIETVASEIINLNAITCLPKGTELFFSDIHGEYEAFLYQLRSASGEIKNKIDQEFAKTVTEQDRIQLSRLICYPEQVLCEVTFTDELLKEWKKITIYRLVHMCKTVSSKYTRSKVRKKMPKDFAYIFDEFLNVADDMNQEYYYAKIIDTILAIEMEDNFILAICELIRKLSVDRLHIIGDIYDRGPRPDIIMEELHNYQDIDIQWGNHDISWMGAAAGNRALMANVIRMAISYNNFDVLEDGYGINLRALSNFAAETYKDDDCKQFMPHVHDRNQFDPVDFLLAAKMHKAITIIQLKLEGQLLKRHPEYGMENRRLLEKINFETNFVTIDGKEYPLTDRNLPTVKKEAPLELSQEEKYLMDVLAHSFHNSSLLHKHIRFLYAKGSMYKKINGNLLYHGCIPMTEDGEFYPVSFGSKEYKGVELLDFLDIMVNKAYFHWDNTKEQEEARDFLWYLWCGRNSPLFGKSKLSMFENYFIEENKGKTEIYNPYFRLSQQEDICKKILKEFDLDENASHIINGHVPVRLKEGESPIKGNGRLFIIDGGLSKAYQPKTGIAGYTLIYSSRHLSLAEHKPFCPEKEDHMIGCAPALRVVETMPNRILVGDTDNGAIIMERIKELRILLNHYRDGIIKETKQK
jgi:fructose-1,6-bisphosphatase-3